MGRVRYLCALPTLLGHFSAHIGDVDMHILELSSGGGALPQRIPVCLLHHGRDLVVAPERLSAVRQQFVHPRVHAIDLRVGMMGRGVI